jgi:hypothetical protein
MRSSTRAASGGNDGGSSGRSTRKRSRRGRVGGPLAPARSGARAREFLPPRGPVRAILLRAHVGLSVTERVTATDTAALIHGPSGCHAAGAYSTRGRVHGMLGSRQQCAGDAGAETAQGAAPCPVPLPAARQVPRPDWSRRLRSAAPPAERVFSVKALCSAPFMPLHRGTASAAAGGRRWRWRSLRHARGAGRRVTGRTRLRPGGRRTRRGGPAAGVLLPGRTGLAPDLAESAAARVAASGSAANDCRTGLGRGPCRLGPCIRHQPRRSWKM